MRTVLVRIAAVLALVLASHPAFGQDLSVDLFGKSYHYKARTFVALNVTWLPDQEGPAVAASATVSLWHRK